MNKTFFIVLSVSIFCLSSLILLTWIVRPEPRNSLSDAEWIPPEIIKPPGQIVLPALTLSSILVEDHLWTATLSSNKVSTLLVTGDVLTARSVNAKNVALNDFTWPFLKTFEKLKQADLTFINLETPLIPDCPVRTEGMSFCGDVRNVEGLKLAGVDIVNLANNHMGNFGEEGVLATINVLEQAGINTTGITGPTVLEVKGTTFAFLGYNEVDRQPGVPYPSDELIQTEIKQASSLADVVIVQFHWGNEYTYQPSSNQKRLAQLAIESGADLVVGNHPHWWQPPEIYKEKLIMYSHGNLVFDQMWSEETREGLVGIYTFYEDTLVDVEFLPIKIEEYGQPRWLENIEKAKVLEKLKLETTLLEANF